MQWLHGLESASTGILVYLIPLTEEYKKLLAIWIFFP